MALLGDDLSITTFEGLEVKRSVSNTGIREDDIQDSLAEDQAKMYQTIVDKNLSTGTPGSYAGTAQGHTGTTGARLPWELSSVILGAGKASAIDGSYTVNVPILNGRNTGGVSRRILYRWPVFFPAGHTGCIISGVTYSLFKNFGARITTQDKDFTGLQIQPYTLGNAQDFPNPNIDFICSGLTANDVNIITLEVDISDQDEWAEVGHISVTPEGTDGQNNFLRDAPDADSTDLNDSLRGTADDWGEIYSGYTADGEALNSLTTGRLAENDTLIYEVLTGQPAPGYASTTHTAHNHDGDNSKKISLPIISAGFGYVDLGAMPIGTYDGDGIYGTGNGEGAYGAAPTMVVDDVDPVQIYRAAVQVPDIDEVGSGTDLIWSAIVYADTSSVTDGDLDVQITTTDTVTLNAPASPASRQDTQSVAVSGSGDNWHYVTGTVSAAKNALNHIILEAEITDNKVGVGFAVTGFEMHIEVT